MSLDLGPGGGFSAPTAAKLASLSELSYLPPTEQKEIARRDGFRLGVALSTGGGTQVFVYEGEQDVVVVFRGTEITCLEDVKTDLRVRKVVGALGGKVHRGFLRAVEEVEGALTEALVPFDNDEADMRLWITGHSLGGALAHLYACLLPLGLRRRLRGVYTFGAPRVGNWLHARRFREAVGELEQRVVRSGDPVSILPPLVIGYVHANPMVYVDVDGRVRLKISPLERLISIIRSLPRASVLHYHLIAGYRSVLQRLLHG